MATDTTNPEDHSHRHRSNKWKWENLEKIPRRESDKEMMRIIKLNPKLPFRVARMIVAMG